MFRPRFRPMFRPTSWPEPGDLTGQPGSYWVAPTGAPTGSRLPWQCRREGGHVTTAVLRQEPEHVRALVTRLIREYGDRLPTDTVVEVVHSCYQPLAEARITAFVPTLVEHASRDRLRRLSKAGITTLAPASQPARSTRKVLRAIRAGGFRAGLGCWVARLPGRRCGQTAGNEGVAPNCGVAVAPGANVTWLRPAALARYSARSAAASSSVRSEPLLPSMATPTETVTRITSPSVPASPAAATWCCRRCATRRASAGSVSGSRTANSSPPKRPRLS